MPQIIHTLLYDLYNVICCDGKAMAKPSQQIT